MANAQVTSPTIKITMDTYGHLYSTEDHRTRTAIDTAFTSGDGHDDPLPPLRSSAKANVMTS